MFHQRRGSAVVAMRWVAAVAVVTVAACRDNTPPRDPVKAALIESARNAPERGKPCNDGGCPPGLECMTHQLFAGQVRRCDISCWDARDCPAGWRCDDCNDCNSDHTCQPAGRR
jgi:hypothetical protein